MYHQSYGLYVDVMNKSKGKWRFVQRDYYYLWMASAPFTGEVFALPANLSGTK